MLLVDVSVRDLGGHAVVALRGQLDLADATSVGACLTAAAEPGGPSVIVDLAGLDYIDCCGLGVLVGALKRARERAGDLCLAAPQDRVLRIMKITGLDDVFAVYRTAEEAASAVTPRPLSGAAHH